MLHALTLGVRGQRQHEGAAVVLGGQIQRRTQRLEAQVRAQRHRIGTQRRGGAEPRIRVGLHGRADVAALRVSHNQHAVGGGAGEQRLQHGQAGRAVTLKQRHLRLQRGREGCATLVHGLGEGGQTLGGILQAPLLQQVRVRVNAHAQRAALGHRLRQAVTKGSGHYASPPSEARRASTAAASLTSCSCRLMMSQLCSRRAVIA